jgi:DNA-binding XRE family transcriptional regulator
MAYQVTPVVQTQHRYITQEQGNSGQVSRSSRTGLFAHLPLLYPRVTTNRAIIDRQGSDSPEREPELIHDGTAGGSAPVEALPYYRPMANSVDLRPPPCWTFGERLRKVRREMGLTQPEFAALIKINKGTLGAYESGRRHPPERTQAHVAAALEKRTGFPAWWIAGQMPPANPSHSHSAYPPA